MVNLSGIPKEAPSASIGDELPPGTSLCGGQYVIEQFLNAGGFGVTYLARDSLNRKVVVKECFPNSMCCRSGQSVRLRSRSFEQDFDRIVELFQKEARALARLQHPSIVGVHQIFEGNNTAYMALDYVAGLDLFELMERHPEYLSVKSIKGILTTLLSALAYVHENGIIHRDISPDNILLDANGAPVLIDFGASRQGTNKSRILTRVHTVKDGYSPQEFYFEGAAQSPASDLYALAATMYHLITGAPPPNSSTRLLAVSAKEADPYEKLEGRFPEYGPTFTRCIDACMSLFAKERIPSALDWLRSIDSKSRQRLPGVVPPVVDPDIENKIAALVAQCNADIAKQAEISAQAQREPEDKVDADAERLAAEREYWAILNEDPSKWASEPSVTPAEDAPAPSVAVQRGLFRSLKAAAGTKRSEQSAHKNAPWGFTLSSVLRLS